MSGKTRYVGLSFELGQLCETLDAATLLVDAQLSHQLATEDHERRAPRAVAAVLGLVQQRLQLLRGVLRQQVEPGLILSPANDSTGWSPGDDPDVRIRVRPRQRGSSRKRQRR